MKRCLEYVGSAYNLACLCSYAAAVAVAVAGAMKCYEHVRTERVQMRLMFER